MIPEVVHDGWPVREALRPEQDVFSGEPVGTVLCSVVHKEVTNIEMLVVTENEALVRRLSKVLLYPKKLVRPGRRVVPGGSGEYVRIVDCRQFLEGLNGLCHRLHEAKDSRNVVEVSGERFKLLRFDQWECRREIDKHVVEVDVESFGHSRLQLLCSLTLQIRSEHCFGIGGFFRSRLLDLVVSHKSAGD